MRVGEILELNTFLAVAEEGGFSRAAARLGVSPSAVSQSVRRLEARLGTRMFARTTRSVALTEAGDRLLQEVRPALERLERADRAMAAAAETVAGRVRVSVPTVAMELLVAPALPALRTAYPGVRFEIAVEDRLVDLVAGRLDAVIRRGGLLEQNMVARRLSDDDDLILVAAPDYLSGGPRLETVRDLVRHERIVVRRPRSGAALPWRLRAGGDAADIRSTACVTVPDAASARRCAVAGLGVAYLARRFVADQLESGALRHVLPDWHGPLEGFHLMYRERGGLAPALRALADAVRSVG